MAYTPAEIQAIKAQREIVTYLANVRAVIERQFDEAEARLKRLEAAGRTKPEAGLETRTVREVI